MALTVPERYQYLIDVLSGGNQRRFADQCGLNYFAINKILNDKLNFDPLSPKYTNQILNTFPGVNKNWLLTGEGEPGVAPRSLDVEELRKQLEEKDRLIEDLRAEIRMQRKVIEKLLG